MEIVIEPFRPEDAAAAARVWNEVVEDGVAFPQTEPLTEQEALEFFARQDYTGIAKCGGQVAGLYILHPNNVGRCGHQANSSYAVGRSLRGNHVGEALVRHSLQKAAELGYRLMIFNAVVKGNERALRLYRKLGFVKIGEVPGGFLLKDGHYQDTILFYHAL